MDAKRDKRRMILDRIASFEAQILRSREYLESGAHAEWTGLQPLITLKRRNGKQLPPHRDWVENFFLPMTEKRLHTWQKRLERLDSHAASRANRRARDA
jgi:hypothetical protein